MKILLLPGSYNSSPARFRVWQYEQPLKMLGHEVHTKVIWPERYWGSNLKSKLIYNIHNRIGSVARLLSALSLLKDANKYDVIFMNRDLVPEISIDFLEIWLSKINPRLIFDFDDAIYLGLRAKKLCKIFPYFKWVTPGNEYLAEFVKTYNNNVTIIPTVINSDHYKPIYERRPGPIRLGWSGSSLSFHHLSFVREIICKLAEEVEFEFIVIANKPPKLDFNGIKWRYIPWTPMTEVEGLQEIDIGIMPLQDTPENRGKCGLKAIQYMGVGIPALVSPVGVNKKIVIDAKTGYHCINIEDWITYSKELITNNHLRREFGMHSRKHVEVNYSIRSQLFKLAQVLTNVLK